MNNAIVFEECKLTCYEDLTDEEKEIISIIPDTGIIRNHLERFGSITQKEARSIYGIERLASVIERLRHSRYPLMNIESVHYITSTKRGKRSNYVRYFYKGDVE